VHTHKDSGSNQVFGLPLLREFKLIIKFGTESMNFSKIKAIEKIKDQTIHLARKIKTRHNKYFIRAGLD
jgi:hypothetical protein